MTGELTLELDCRTGSRAEDFAQAAAAWLTEARAELFPEYEAAWPPIRQRQARTRRNPTHPGARRTGCARNCWSNAPRMVRT